MARPVFKRAVIRILPAAIERSTYVLASSAALMLLFWLWMPLGGNIWNVQSVVGRLHRRHWSIVGEALTIEPVRSLISDASEWGRSKRVMTRVMACDERMRKEDLK